MHFKAFKRFNYFKNFSEKFINVIIYINRYNFTLFYSSNDTAISHNSILIKIIISIKKIVHSKQSNEVIVTRNCTILLHKKSRKHLTHNPFSVKEM